MTELLPFIVTGLTSGAVYGLAAVGLVLTYKTSGVFNFAHGAMATVAAYTFYALHVSREMSWPVAAAVCVVVVGPAMGLVLELLARAVGTATLELRVAATIGVMLVVEASVVLIYGDSKVRTVPVFLPDGHFRVSGTIVKTAPWTWPTGCTCSTAASCGIRGTRNPWIATRCFAATSTSAPRRLPPHDRVSASSRHSVSLH